MDACISSCYKVLINGCWHGNSSKAKTNKFLKI
jgi:hypothetical protein